MGADEDTGIVEDDDNELGNGLEPTKGYLLWLQETYACSSPLIAVRKPFCNNAISTNFAVEYAYKLNKYILKNQLVLTFRHRVTASFINFTTWLRNHIGKFNSPLLQQTRQICSFDPFRPYNRESIARRNRLLLVFSNHYMPVLPFVSLTHIPSGHRHYAQNMTSLCK